MMQPADQDKLKAVYKQHELWRKEFMRGKLPDKITLLVIRLCLKNGVSLSTYNRYRKKLKLMAETNLAGK